MAQVRTLAAKLDDLGHTSVKCYAPKPGLEKYLIRGKHGNLEKLDLSFNERGTNFLALITVYSMHTGGCMCITACVWRSEGDFQHVVLCFHLRLKQSLSHFCACAPCASCSSVQVGITDLNHHTKYFYMASRGSFWGKHSYPVGHLGSPGNIVLSGASRWPVVFVPECMCSADIRVTLENFHNYSKES